jgi:hypothetical protein
MVNAAIGVAYIRSPRAGHSRNSQTLRSFYAPEPLRQAPPTKKSQTAALAVAKCRTYLRTPGRKPRCTAFPWYNTDKSFGFNVSDLGGKDIFVHASALKR